jgi:hypothetical protein
MPNTSTPTVRLSNETKARLAALAGGTKRTRDFLRARGMGAAALGGAVVDGDEDRDLPSAGESGGQLGRYIAPKVAAGQRKQPSGQGRRHQPTAQPQLTILGE